MSATPRLRSSFPLSPQRNKSPLSNSSNGSPSGSLHSTASSPRLPDIGTLQPSSKSEPYAPLISFDIIDAPSQRLYVLGFWLLLLLWRLYDYYNLTVDETESLWQFMKWLSIDLVSLYLLESMRIPWLEFNPTTQIVLFFGHALLDGLLMFRIPLPFGTLLIALVRLLYDREMAISEHYVKPADVIHNPSLILGRQIIHVLPEGSAILNPDNIPLCLDPSRFSPSVSLPLRINQTNPVSIELVRYDLDSPENETIVISATQAKRLRKDATKGRSSDPSDPVTLQYAVKKTGLYRLHKVIDETKLEVQGSSEALVVTCPTARLRYLDINRCRGDLSDLSLEVEGTPPLKVTYRKTAKDGSEQTGSYQSIQPEDFLSPLVMQQALGTLTTQNSFDISWARSHVVKVPLNESLTTSGRWAYSIEEVIDGTNNVVKYSEEDEPGKHKSKQAHSEAQLLVHDRPTVMLDGHDVQKPFRVAKGGHVEYPLQLGSTGKHAIANTEHSLTYLFTPVEKISPTGDHSPDAEMKDIVMKSAAQKPTVQDPGLYSLLSVSTPHCAGDVLEPRSFMLINPPEPDFSIVTEEISDKCAGNPIGFRVGLDFVGTPPFSVRYTIRSQHSRETRTASQKIPGMRGQIEFKPDIAGRYTYTFGDVSDSVYRAVSVRHKNLVLEQDVKPSVSAHLINPSPMRRLCIDQSTDFAVKFQGEGPWTLEYELVHGGDRSKQTISDITSDVQTISTGPLTSGGEHSLVLRSVTDKLGCKEALQDDAKISVRHQRPKVSFGSVEGKYTVRALEGKPIDIPLRLAGEAPWTVVYEHEHDGAIERKPKTVNKANDFIQARKRGKYRIVKVEDSVCPGVVENPGEFEIAWIPRPEVSVTQTPLLENVDGQQVRKDVCEGDQDALDIVLTGKPPYDVKYRTLITLDSGKKSTKPDRNLNVPLNSAQIKMDTSQAGTFEYVFIELGDSIYDNDPKRHKPLTIRQKVHPRPTVGFTNPGKVYSFCQSQEDDADDAPLESIPITLTGQPPFTVDFELKRPGRSSGAAEALTFSNIESNQYNVRIPPRYLRAGNSALTIRRVRDNRGCERLYDPSLSPGSSSASSSAPASVVIPRVQISVHDLPTVTPAEDRTHYCVGERIAYSLAGGAAPYTIFYTFDGRERKATEPSSVFRRLAEAPGDFAITAITDSHSTCKRSLQAYGGAAMHKVIHALPSVRVSKGKETRVDIHAGGEADINFEFGGIPPFEFTYIRSENVADRNGRGSGKVGQVLETKTLVSEEPVMSLKARDEGTYEVVAIRDRYCSFAREGYAGFSTSRLLKGA